MKMNFATGLLAGLTACALTPSAIAGEVRMTVPTAVAVPMADLDLRQPADAARLERRILSAVNRACPFERGRERFGHACRAESQSSGRRQLEQAIAAARGSDPALLASR